MHWCPNGKKLIESFRRSNEAYTQSLQNKDNKAAVGATTISTAPDASMSEEELEKNQNYNAQVESYLRIAVSAAYYLASKNAEIKEVKIPKEKRPILVSKPGAAPKKVNVKTYNVGFVIGKSFEKQLASGEEFKNPRQLAWAVRSDLTFAAPTGTTTGLGKVELA